MCKRERERNYVEANGASSGKTKITHIRKALTDIKIHKTITLTTHYFILVESPVSPPRCRHRSGSTFFIYTLSSAKCVNSILSPPHNYIHNKKCVRRLYTILPSLLRASPSCRF